MLPLPVAVGGVAGARSRRAAPSRRPRLLSATGTALVAAAAAALAAAPTPVAAELPVVTYLLSNFQLMGLAQGSSSSIRALDDSLYFWGDQIPVGSEQTTSQYTWLSVDGHTGYECGIERVTLQTMCWGTDKQVCWVGVVVHVALVTALLGTPRVWGALGRLLCCLKAGRRQSNRWAQGWVARSPFSLCRRLSTQRASVLSWMARHAQHLTFFFVFYPLDRSFFGVYLLLPALPFLFLPPYAGGQQQPCGAGTSNRHRPPPRMCPHI